MSVTEADFTRLSDYADGGLLEETESVILEHLGQAGYTLREEATRHKSHAVKGVMVGATVLSAFGGNLIANAPQAVAESRASVPVNTPEVVGQHDRLAVVFGDSLDQGARQADPNDEQFRKNGINNVIHLSACGAKLMGELASSCDNGKEDPFKKQFNVPDVEELLKQEPVRAAVAFADVVQIKRSTNDFTKDQAKLEQLQATLEARVKTIKEINPNVVVQIANDYSNDEHASFYEAMNPYIAAAAQNSGAELLDYATAAKEGNWYINKNGSKAGLHPGEHYADVQAFYASKAGDAVKNKPAPTPPAPAAAPAPEAAPAQTAPVGAEAKATARQVASIREIKPGTRGDSVAKTILASNENLGVASIDAPLPANRTIKFMVQKTDEITQEVTYRTRAGDTAKTVTLGYFKAAGREDFVDKAADDFSDKIVKAAEITAQSAAPAAAPAPAPEAAPAPKAPSEHVNINAIQDIKSGGGIIPAQTIKDTMVYLMDTLNMPAKNAAYFTGNLITESGLNPDAQGDRIDGQFTAFGLAQWRGGRLEGMPRGDFFGQLEFAIKVDMPKQGMGILETMFNPNATTEELRTALANYERYAEFNRKDGKKPRGEGGRFEFGQQITDWIATLSPEQQAAAQKEQEAWAAIAQMAQAKHDQEWAGASYAKAMNDKEAASKEAEAQQAAQAEQARQEQERQNALAILASQTKPAPEAAPAQLDIHTDAGAEKLCADLTQEFGIQVYYVGTSDGYHQGQQETVWLCQIGNTVSARFNVDVIRNFVSLTKAARDAGVPLDWSEGYRTMQQQQHFWDLYQSGRGNLAAKPGFSNHQMGRAGDAAGAGANAWLAKHAQEHGLRVNSREAWHISVDGS